ncbi:FAD:protein FMN transferase ApbE [Veronia nyctiphanis]|uniref:FAD:protein FMN transferase n=1 Tax=Veronia nyctiphanis TaxID=1278244 RepID=A0A4Q0YPQ2_9GAMM|nr:FAD:protein FMN transferase [Veronia nyctiphanis]RXJ72962.1 FAD:protein FMN transferase ApbE [Veronia nyctiphanis]
MKKLLLQAGLILGLALSVVGCEKAPELVHLKGKTMGTYYSVKFTDDGSLPKAEEIQAEIDKRLELVNDQMSTYRKSSELSQFNQSRETAPFTVSADTAKVVAEAMRLNKVTQGALDVTVGPLVNLWGFGPEGRPDRVPSEEQIAERRAISGIEHLSVNGNTLTKYIPELYVDLSSIAKGFGVDVVADYLASLGAHNYLVEIGGELQLKGVNQEGQPWKIAIEKPTVGLQSVQEIIAPGDMAMATSGSYRNYFEENGVRYSHAIDPRTANPINHRLVSVTVLDKSCMTADGLSTGFMVLGAEKALELANKENIAAFFIVKTDDGFNEVASDAFAKYLSK